MVKEEKGVFVSFDNTQIYYVKNTVENPKGIIIVVHGLSEHSGRYINTCKYLNDSGYSTLSFDNRGNGQSGGPKGSVGSFHDFLEDIHLFVCNERKTYEKVYLLGHSLGGFLVNAYGAKYNDVNAIVSSGAVGIYLKSVKPFLIIPFQPFKNIDIKLNLSGQLSHDKTVSANYVDDKYVAKSNKLNLFGEVFIKGIKYLRKNIKSLTVPIIHLHGKKDSIVPYQSSVYLNANVGSINKEIKLYDEMYHEVLNELDKEVVFNDIICFLEKY